jgi:PAS domain S-box-containing protein
VSFVSAQVEKIIGYTPEEMVNDSSLWFNAIHPDDISKVLILTQQIGTTPQGIMREYRLLHKHTGEYRWLEDRSLPQFDAAGKLIGAFGVARDVTERKQADNLAHESEARYRTLAEAARDSIFIINRDGIIEYVNRFAAEQFRVALEQIIGKYMRQIFPPNVGEAQMASLRKVFETGQPYSSETRTVFPHGEVWLNTSLVPLNDEAGSVRAVMGVSRDITERKRADEENQRRANQFAALLETTRDISARQENLSGLLQSIVDRAVDLLQAYSGMVHLYDPATQDLELVMERNAFAQVGMRLKLGEGIAGKVAQTCQPLIVDDYRTWEGHSPQLKDLPIAAVMSVPLLYGGELIGTLTIAETGGKVDRKFTEDDSRLLSLFAAHVSGALRNAYSLSEMRRRVDELTTISQVSSALRYALTPSLTS